MSDTLTFPRGFVYKNNMCSGNNKLRTLYDVTINTVMSQSQIQMVDMEITFLITWQTPDEIAERSKPLVETVSHFDYPKSFVFVSFIHIYMYMYTCMHATDILFDNSTFSATTSFYSHFLYTSNFSIKLTYPLKRSPIGGLILYLIYNSVLVVKGLVL